VIYSWSFPSKNYFALYLYSLAYSGQFFIDPIHLLLNGFRCFAFTE